MKTIKNNPIVLAKVISYSLFAVAAFTIVHKVIVHGSNML